jgi:hypothetical protein
MNAVRDEALSLTAGNSLELSLLGKVNVPVV